MNLGIAFRIEILYLSFENVKYHLVCVVCFAVIHVFYSVYFHEAIIRLLLCIKF